jgi:hypothetical protein
MRPAYLLLTTILLCALCSAAPAQEQQEGQPLNPTDWMSVDSDDNLHGTDISSVVGIPITATVDAENTRTDSHGRSVTLRYRSKVYRDSKGGTRLESDVTPSGELPKPAWDMIEICDPTTGTNIILYPSTKTFDDLHAPLPDEKQQQIDNDPETHKIDNSYALKLFGPRAVQQVTQRELAHDVVDGMVVRHGRESAKLLHSSSRGRAAFDMLTDYWFSQELQVFVLIKRTGPGKSQHAIKLSDISRDEPNPSLFTVPPDYQPEPPS